MTDEQVYVVAEALSACESDDPYYQALAVLAALEASGSDG